MIKKDLQLFQELANRLLDFETMEPVAPYISPEDISTKIDLSLNDEGISDEAFVDVVSPLLKYTPKTATPQFFNQLFGGRQGKAVVGELLSVLLNNSMYTYKVGGPMVLIEKTILNRLKQMAGYPSSSEGTIASGGSMTNFMALLMARDHHAPNAPSKGISQNALMTVYTSQESHYSIDKNAAFAGIGRDQVRKIGTDSEGRMDSIELLENIKKDKDNGHHPFFVNATAGTTVLGAFDQLKEIAKICKEVNLWLHVDGAYGGSALFSDRYKHLLDGVELSDSFSINAHKMMGVPITCSFILSKHKKALYDSFSNDANYLYQTDSDEINPGKISLQCGRRNDVLKFWTLWKSKGTSGLRQMVDHQFDLADYARDYVKGNTDYTLYNEGPSVNICFNYKGISPERLCNSLYENASLMIGYGSYKDTTFIRLVTLNAGNSKEVIRDFFKRLESHAATLIEQGA